MSHTILPHFYIRQITCLRAFLVVETMRFAQRVAVFAGRDERRPSAVSFIMDVNAVQPRGQAARVYVDANQAISVLGKVG